MFRFLAASLLVASLCALTACNTVSGFGRDVEAIGGGVAAEPAKKR